MGPISGFEKLHVSFRGNLIRYGAFVMMLSFASALQAQVVDPGPRGTSVGAGGPIANLSRDQILFFNDPAARFKNPEGVEKSLGPTLNGDCGGVCHSEPAIGGSSPRLG